MEGDDHEAAFSNEAVGGCLKGFSQVAKLVVDRAPQSLKDAGGGMNAPRPHAFRLNDEIR